MRETAYEALQVIAHIWLPLGFGSEKPLKNPWDPHIKKGVSCWLIETPSYKSQICMFNKIFRIIVEVHFGNSLKPSLKKFMNFFFNQNNHVDKTNSYVKPKIAQAKHFMIKKTSSKNLGFPKKSKKNYTMFSFFRSHINFFCDHKSKNITSRVFSYAGRDVLSFRYSVVFFFEEN